MQITGHSTRFGAYSLETYQRRQSQKIITYLLGHKSTDVFQRLKRNLSTGTNQWGGLVPDPNFLKLLEERILVAARTELIELDQAFEAFDGIVPEYYAKLIEYQAFRNEKKAHESILADAYAESHRKTNAQAALHILNTGLSALDFKPE